MTTRTYAAVLFWLLALPAFAWHFSLFGPLRAPALWLLTPEPVYLANLREPTLACKTLALRRAEVVVVGDSHSFSAWDFAEIERRLGRTVGACPLSGLYAESFSALLNYVLTASPRTTLVIFGVSPRMFWESSTKQEQINFHRHLFDTMAPDVIPFVRRKFLGEPLPHDREAEAAQRHERWIETLDEGSLVARLDRSHNSIRTLRDWNARLQNVRFTPGLDRVVQDFCRKVRSAGLRLWVLHIPESPYLEMRYTKETWDRYSKAANALGTCAEKVVLDQTNSYGLGNRHFVNRQLQDEHDYAGWSLPTPVSDDLAFDADHLNPIGARVFTPLALDRLRAE